MTPALEAHLVIDYASSSVKAVYRMTTEKQIRPVRLWDYGVPARDIDGLEMTESMQSLPNRVYFDKDQGMDIGNCPNSLVGSKRALCPKLFPDGDAEILRQELKRHNKKPVDVLCLAFKKTLKAFRKSVERDHGLKKEQYRIGVVTLTIPEIFAQGDESDTDIQAAYLEAAKEAGFPMDRLRFETEAMATAIYLVDVLSWADLFGSSKQINIVDLGGSTWDALTIGTAASKPVQARLPQGGVGGMDKIWAKLRDMFADGSSTEPYEFVNARYCIYSMEVFEDIKSGNQLKVSKEELLAMFEDAWRSLFECMERWLSREKEPELRIVGGAPASSKLVRSFLATEFNRRRIKAIFPPHPDPATAVCRGAIIPWDNMDLNAILETSQIGFLFFHGPNRQDVMESARPLKASNTKLGSITDRFETLQSDQGEIQLWLYYSESGNALGEKSTTTGGMMDQIWKFECNEATLLDPIKIKLGEKTSEAVHFRFIQDKTDKGRLYLEVYSESEYKFTSLRITRDRTRVLLEQEEDNPSLTHVPALITQISKEFFDQVAITSGKNFAKLRHNGFAKMACLNLGPNSCCWITQGC